MLLNSNGIHLRHRKCLNSGFRSLTFAKDPFLYPEFVVVNPFDISSLRNWVLPAEGKLAPKLAEHRLGLNQELSSLFHWI